MATAAAGTTMAILVSRCVAMRAVQDALNPNWRNVSGGPSAKSIVTGWQEAHPTGTQRECESETGLCHATVSRWWDKYFTFHVVKRWRESHHRGTKAACKRDTGLSYPTIRKWWDCPIGAEETPFTAIIDYRENYPNADPTDAARSLHLPLSMVAKAFEKIDTSKKFSGVSEKIMNSRLYENYQDTIEMIMAMKRVSYEVAEKIVQQMLGMDADMIASYFSDIKNTGTT